MKIFYVFLFFFFHTSASSQNLVYNDQEIKILIKSGLDKTYNFEFDSAEKIYAQVKVKYPLNPAYNFLMALNSYWKMFYFNNYKEKSSEYLKFLEDALQQTEQLDKIAHNNPETIFFYLAIHSSFALYFVQNKEKMKAVGSAKKTYDNIRNGYPLKEKYAELYFSSGIYDFYREQYPITHPVYKSFLWMFAPGSKQKGLQELLMASKYSVFSRTEAKFYLVMILLKYENDPTGALLHADGLIKQYPKNMNFLMKYAEALTLSGNFKEAEKYSYILNKNPQKIFQMASYVFFGIIYEKEKLKSDLAKSYYMKSLKIAKEVEFPVNEYVGMAYAGLARIAIAHDEKDLAEKHYESALEFSEYTSIKKEAELYLKK